VQDCSLTMAFLLFLTNFCRYIGWHWCCVWFYCTYRSLCGNVFARILSRQSFSCNR